MINGSWRKRLCVWRNRLYFYPPPEPLPHSRAFWLAMGLVTLFVVLFASYFMLYLTGRQDAYMTNAEDLGIMDQAIWNTIHGHLLHQTICNSVNDTNCYNFSGITRFAIHFEPILLPISLLYLAWPGPKTLQVLQTLVVASGAFPAFWLARLRLRNEWASVAIALLYLLYPAQQNAIIFDFHAVTLTASLLLFILYFMYTRSTTWLFVCAILAMACKEEIPVVVVCFGLWSMLFQRRWRSGLVLVLLALTWTSLGLLVVHLYSPTGYSLLASRYAYLGHSPLQIARTFFIHPLGILKQHVMDRSHRAYLNTLFAPAAYLPLLAPWVLLLALPSLALNLLSSDLGMYSGIFHYNAEIVPILIFATIESIVLILWLAQWGMAHLHESFKRTFIAEHMEKREESRRGGSGVDVERGPLWPPAGGDTRVPHVSIEEKGTAGYLSPRQGSHKGPHYLSPRQGPPPNRPCPYAIPNRMRPVGKNPTPVKGHLPTPGQTQDLPLLCYEAACHGRSSIVGAGLAPALGRRGAPPHRRIHIFLLIMQLSYLLFSVIHADFGRSGMPFAQDFRWPRTTAHTELAQCFIVMIPSTASISAQSRLVPHVSQRLNVYMFPYADDRANYILLDVTGDKYPYFSTQAYTREVMKVLNSGNYSILAAADGYLLLKRRSPPQDVFITFPGSDRSDRDQQQ